MLSTTERPTTHYPASHSTPASQARTVPRERDRERGQALVVFALAGFVLMGAAAISFDTGAILLEKRTQQNAADAAALAGSRYLPGNNSKAHNQALAIASANGYTDGVDGVTVSISFPNDNRIRVTINDPQPSLFASVFGIDSWDVGSSAVATNEARPSGPFALLSLDDNDCPATEMSGSGTIKSSGNIQVNSACNSGHKAFRVAGNGSLYLTAQGIGCNVVGGATSEGSAVNECHPASTGQQSIPDPYSLIPYPDKPALPLPIEAITGHPIPSACPGGSSPATDAAPALCNFGGTYDSNKTWRLYPGYYPGGINLQGGNFFLEPGIYYVADGGFRVANAGVWSVDAGGTTFGGGILIFNTTHPSTSTSPGQVVLQGGSAGVRLLPLDEGSDWDGFVILQDKAVTLTVEIVGGGSAMDVRGVIYAPGAHVQAQGNTGTLTMDQIVGNTVRVAGNGGTINIVYDWEHLPLLRMAGLIQ